MRVCHAWSVERRGSEARSDLRWWLLQVRDAFDELGHEDRHGDSGYILVDVDVDRLAVERAHEPLRRLVRTALAVRGALQKRRGLRPVHAVDRSGNGDTAPEARGETSV